MRVQIERLRIEAKEGVDNDGGIGVAATSTSASTTDFGVLGPLIPLRRLAMEQRNDAYDRSKTFRIRLPTWRGCDSDAARSDPLH